MTKDDDRLSESMARRLFWTIVVTMFCYCILAICAIIQG